ncbi:hypothetical protein MLD38_024474 [Melastoma candidum]|uniref:Uncharacterized protein n=1 Tax=Melastoma candidum TaxID=119954 RepID=A0ACB9NV34_9MYRT|nr:hypothetical protein MLD38_024474 [Melastoma candidum]
MGETAASGDDEFDWNTEDELEIENYISSTSPCMASGGEVLSRSGSGETSPAGSSDPRLFDHFVGMGFPENLVAKALKENCGENDDLILEYLLSSMTAIAGLVMAPQEQGGDDSDQMSSYFEGSLCEGSSDFDSSESEISMDLVSIDNKKLIPLVEMGYSIDEASIAYERCGPDATLGELADFICAAQLAKEQDALLGPLPEVKPRSEADIKKRKLSASGAQGRKGQRRCEKLPSTEDEENIRLPNPMIGFGVPNELSIVVHRRLPEVGMGPPYFYYENVALAPKGVWDTISRFLYEIEPEFVDSKFFCAAARKRGYIHNLPISNRFPLLPLPPQTIHEALPLTKRWWPSWDTRTKFNCLQTCVGSAKLTERIRKALEPYEGEPPPGVQKYVIEECRKWNLVWVGKNKVAPLEPDEVEMLLGFPRNHTRGGGISRTDRYKSLGNSFQVDTVAYHLSVLKELYPKGINVLSLFSGIGGAEVALHRLGIPLKNVVSVEISETVDADRLERMMDAFGGFDLVVGGSPCNNLTGSNRCTRDGLEGKESALFYDYFRILDCVMSRSRS